MSVKAAMYALLAEREQTPPEVKHCVAKVAPKYGGDTSRAFAICVAAKNKGNLKTRKKTNPKTLKKYEKILKKARK